MNSIYINNYIVKDDYIFFNGIEVRRSNRDRIFMFNFYVEEFIFKKVFRNKKV